MFKSLSATLQNSELQKRCDEQEETIVAYEKKLKEVIRAYKSLNKEKKALQSSLEAISGVDDAPAAPKLAADGSAPPESESDAESVRDDERLTTLQKALATVSKEKSRAEASFQADRKQWIAERESLETEWERSRIEWRRAETLLNQQLSEAQASLRQAQVEAEGTTSDHGAVLAEVQASLAAQRLASAHLKAELEGTQRRAAEPDASVGLIRDLRVELRQLREAETKKDVELRGLRSLERELSESRLRESAANEALARRSVAEAEGKARGEARLKGLEASVAELSGLLGEKEAEKAAAEAALPKLKARLAEAEAEARTARASATAATDESWPGLQSRLKELGKALRRAQPEPVGLDIYELLGLDSPSSPSSHAPCLAELEAVKEEFEKYKLRAQAVLKSRTTVKDDRAKGESESEAHLRCVVGSLQQKLNSTEAQIAVTESHHADEVVKLKAEMVSLESKLQKANSERRVEESQKLAEVEHEMSKLRDRTLSVLAEKEEELQTARTIIASLRHLPVSELAQVPPSDPLASAVAVEPTSKTPSPTPEVLPLPPAEAESHSVYYATELSKREAELGELRRRLRGQESALRDLQHSAVSKELRHHETLEALKEELRLAEGRLGLRKDGANLEYLRNVLLQYMLCESAEGKAHMLKALGQLLRLSPKELESVKAHNTRWYWWNSKTTPPHSTH